jgi:hypothetical protein
MTSRYAYIHLKVWYYVCTYNCGTLYYSETTQVFTVNVFFDINKIATYESLKKQTKRYMLSYTPSTYDTGFPHILPLVSSDRLSHIHVVFFSFFSCKNFSFHVNTKQYDLKVSIIMIIIFKTKDIMTKMLTL